MKNWYKIIFLLLSQIMLGQGTWQKIWADEFDYTGLPQADKWSYDEGCGVTNNEAQYYAKERLKNTRVENGNLVIEAHKEDLYGCKYTSGRIKSQYKGDWKYGKFEVRAKFPTFKGSWPAIWFLPTDSKYGSWPKSGEIDLMENVGYEPNTAHFTIHTEAYNHQIGTQKGQDATVNNVAADFHTYTLYWYPDSLCMYLDNVKHFTFKKDGDYTKWPFDQPFHILLNLAIGGDWGGSQGIDDTKFPAQYLVDYVRVYQWQETQGPYTLNIEANHGDVAVIPSKSTYTLDEEVTLTATPNEGYQFKGWSSDFFASNNPLTISMNRSLNIKPLFKKIGELVQNGGFEDGSRYWYFSSYGTAKASYATENNVTQVNVTTANTTKPWEVQLIQYNIALLKGHTYLFSFDIEADQDMGVIANVGLNADPWTVYGGLTFVAGTVKSSQSKTFTMSVDDHLARISFDLGKNTGLVKISNVSIVDQTLSAVSDALENDALKVYYNPDNQKIQVTSATPMKSILVSNVWGSVLYKSDPSNALSVDIPLWDRIAVLKVIDTQGRVRVCKLVRP